jgi:hypothetical protein
VDANFFFCYRCPVLFACQWKVLFEVKSPVLNALMMKIISRNAQRTPSAADQVIGRVW